jgi:hypothetical protein
MRLLNKRGTFDKEGQRLLPRYIWFKMLDCIVCEFKAFSLVALFWNITPHNFYVLNRDVLRQLQFRKFNADKRIRKLEGFKPSINKRRKS